MKNTLKNLTIELLGINITAYYAGGYVRDTIMGIPCDDVDICLVGVTDTEKVEKLLRQYCYDVTTLVGEAFPVWKAKIGDKSIDFAMARKEILNGNTRKDFIIETKDVTIEEDLKRRDFTINAIAQNVLTDEIIDPFYGKAHINTKLLHPTSNAFCEDTLRVYRAARFLARFSDFFPSSRLIELCEILKPDDISCERVGMEFFKMLQQAVVPSKFFYFLKEIGWLKHHFIELSDLIGIPQSPKHHPEGDAFEHTMYTLDEAKDWFTRVCMICHDLGKSITTTINNIVVDKETINDPIKSLGDIKIKSIGHEEAGVSLTVDMLSRIKFANNKIIKQVSIMTELHMIRIGVNEKVIRKTLRKLTENDLDYMQLVEVCRCDLSGRPPLAGYTPDIGQHRVKELLLNDEMRPIVTGKKLIEAGYTPNKRMGELINKCLEWQDRGTLNHDNWLKMIKQYKN